MSNAAQQLDAVMDTIIDEDMEALRALADDTATIKANLTNGEKAIIAKGMKAYKAGKFIPLEIIVKQPED